MLAVAGAFLASPGSQSFGLSPCVSSIVPSHCLIPDRLPEGVVTFMFSVEMSMLGFLMTVLTSSGHGQDP